MAEETDISLFPPLPAAANAPQEENVVGMEDVMPSISTAESQDADDARAAAPAAAAASAMYAEPAFALMAKGSALTASDVTSAIAHIEDEATREAARLAGPKFDEKPKIAWSWLVHQIPIFVAAVKVCAD